MRGGVGPRRRGTGERRRDRGRGAAQELRRGAGRARHRRRDRRRRDGRAARPQRRRQVDHDRHDPRPRRARRRHGLGVRRLAHRGRRRRARRRDAADRRADPRPLGRRAGGDGRLALPRAAGGGGGARADGPQRDRRPAHAEALRRADPARALRGRAGQRRPSCSCSTSRPWRWTSRAAAPSGRRCASLPRAARRSCSPPTTWRRPTPTPTARC